MERDEISNIARQAAHKVTVSQRCKEIGEKLINSREVLQAALDMAAHAKHPEDIVSSGLAKDMIIQAKELEREVLLTGDEAMRLEVSLASALEAVNKADYDTAISHILKARSGLLDLLFQEVVTCECGEAKAIEEKLGKEALRKILAAQEIDETAAATEYLTITDPGGTTFNVGEIVSCEAFEEENERVKKLGEKPATGR